ncbi:tRNA preQ1(34) S-adenosylmethionine ribosyltransferase-isomerase QueA [Salicibibacter halophilus]|uniref:S-adenosylmethionine:tRNA ribosyltransferase-isomerase n=1 Tax=Salicibibacter halophilus TaxID=2502791 RepID=A0A514LLS6_9BACI|nr:tRNA preQ1(34) S-adenosylmethionine ribosyltransferase-isomerase QueA [Salicibibacter halophilus]QDI92819.1 tRNA preQ1(34) S-adenosylmethionine ribosyltransferase-isomerase QueA [Salicibibacter halophilus]
MKMDAFDFELPESLIAQRPLPNRDAARMLVLDRESGDIDHQRFSDIGSFFQAGDCLVLNDTRVLPARLFGEKKETGANVEVLLLNEGNADEWETLVKPAKKVKVGTEIIFGDGRLTAVCIGLNEHGGRLLRFHYNGFFMEILDALGTMPLPPYITEQLEEPERYQTVYANKQGSAAAPTAGLHFTEERLDELRAIGVEICYITLHVGLGTFRPVSVERVEDHEMHAEHYEVSAETAVTLNEAKKAGREIIACGTTSARTLETIMHTYGEFKKTSGWTDIFIYPGFDFRGVDGLITNFHLPKSTLIMLVSAFAGKEAIMRAYREAIAEQYRFFSFGDAMYIRKGAISV